MTQKLCSKERHHTGHPLPSLAQRDAKVCRLQFSLSSWCMLQEDGQPYGQACDDIPIKWHHRHSKWAQCETQDIDRCEARGATNDGPGFGCLPKWRDDAQESDFKNAETQTWQHVCNENTANPMPAQSENKNWWNEHSYKHEDHCYNHTCPWSQTSENHVVPESCHKLSIVNANGCLSKCMCCIRAMRNAKLMFISWLQGANHRGIPLKHTKHDQKHDTLRWLLLWLWLLNLFFLFMLPFWHIKFHILQVILVSDACEFRLTGLLQSWHGSDGYSSTMGPRVSKDTLSWPVEKLSIDQENEFKKHVEQLPDSCIYSRNTWCGVFQCTIVYPSPVFLCNCLLFSCIDRILADFSGYMFNDAVIYIYYIYKQNQSEIPSSWFSKAVLGCQVPSMPSRTRLPASFP